MVVQPIYVIDVDVYRKRNKSNVTDRCSIQATCRGEEREGKVNKERTSNRGMHIIKERCRVPTSEEEINSLVV